MTYTSVSPKYQVVIPKEIREKLDLKPKQKMIVMESNGVVYLIPDRPLRQLKGHLKLLDLEGLREEEERL